MDNVQVSTLPNGIRVATSAMPGVGSITLGIWAGVGSRHEPARLNGASHLIEHMLFKGTRRRTSRDISAEIEGHGGYLNAFTQEESTCYFARVAAEKTEAALDVLSDMFFHSRFDPEEMQRERGVIIEEIMMYRDQPQQQVQERLTELLWARHPLGRSVAGTPESLKIMTRDEILRFQARHYIPSNTYFIFAGKTDHDACVRAVLRQTRSIHPAPVPRPFLPASFRTPQQHFHAKSDEIEQTHMALGFRLFGRHDRRKYALRVLSVILGENMSSRLFQRIREQHGMAYTIHSSLHLLADTGALTIEAGLERKRMLKAFGMIAGEIRRLKTRAVSAAELERAKDYISGQILLGLESTSHQMTWLGEQLLSFGRIMDPETLIRQFHKVSANDIQSLANHYLHARRASLAMIAPGLDPALQRRITDILQKI